MSSAREILRDGAVRRWSLAAGVSQAGDQLWFVALAWTAVRLGGPALAGVTMAAASVPRAALMLVGGALADRVDLRRLMVSATPPAPWCWLPRSWCSRALARRRRC